MIEGHEEFTESQLLVLQHYVTNTTGHVFALRNLPEVIKGALFSRYSRSSLGLRSLLLKEFVFNEETAFQSIVGGHQMGSQPGHEDQIVAIKKAQNFYDRILDGYGDDSIGELGGAHLAVENVSMLAAKQIEDCRIGGSPLEKSTRYIYFDQKVGGEYLYHREPILMTSAFREPYLKVCDMLFDTYSSLIPPLTELMEKKCPKDHDVSKVAYAAAIRAKVLDCLRGLLPASALTNLGVYGNGRFFETLMQKLHSHNLSEMQEIGKKAFQEISKVMPSFVRRGDATHKHAKGYVQFKEQMANDLRILADRHTSSIGKMRHAGVRLIDYDVDCPSKVAAALLFEHSQSGFYELQEYCKTLSEEEVNRILDAASSFRENRRHKSPRALELAEFTFEVVGDFGMYRDLHRHRMLTQDRQLLTCQFSYFVPNEIVGTDMEEKYCNAMEEAKKVYDAIAEELVEEAQYIVPMAYNMHWYMHVNLRSLQWLCELRSTPAGHASYRFVAQELARQVCKVFPGFERFFKFVDFEGYELGRLGQEVRIIEKKLARSSHV